MEKLSLKALNRPELEEFLSSDKFPVRLLLDNIRSALNVGSIFRTSDAFALQGLDLCGITAVPPHREILKTALGSTHSVQWTYWESSMLAVEHYRQIGYTIVSIEQVDNSVGFEEIAGFIDRPILFVLGNEVDGVADEIIQLSDANLEIEQYGTKHSLNVAVCAGIVAWEWVNRLRSH
ncbi:MAG: TrmH family RNA methyltransferase [Saprospiraceae bacterium]